MILMILSCMTLFLTQMVWAQEKCEAPVWNVGDKWTYKRAEGGTWTNKVVDIKEDVFILKVEGSRDLNAYDKKTMNVKYLIKEGGSQVQSENSLRKLLDFPIFLGKKWDDISYAYPTGDTRKRAGATIFANDFKVEGIEDVITAAGTFKAYKIYYQHSSRKTKDSG